MSRETYIASFAGLAMVAAIDAMNRGKLARLPVRADHRHPAAKKQSLSLQRMLKKGKGR